MKELGENSSGLPQEVGEYAANSGVDLVVDTRRGEQMSCGRRPCGEGDPGRGVLDRDEMVKYLEQEVKDGDCILFKGSNSMGLHRCRGQICGTGREVT